MLAKLLNPPSVVKAESRMTQLHAVHKETPWAAKFGWFNHGRCQKALALRGMKDNVRVLLLLLFRLARVTPFCRSFCWFVLHCYPVFDLFNVWIYVSFPLALYCHCSGTCHVLSLCISFYARHHTLRLQRIAHARIFISPHSPSCIAHLCIISKRLICCCVRVLPFHFHIFCIHLRFCFLCNYLVTVNIFVFASCSDVLEHHHPLSLQPRCPSLCLFVLFNHSLFEQSSHTRPHSSTAVQRHLRVRNLSRSCGVALPPSHAVVEPRTTCFVFLLVSVLHVHPGRVATCWTSIYQMSPVLSVSHL